MKFYRDLFEASLNRVIPEHARRAFRGIQYAIQQADSRRFACAVVTQQSEHFACIHIHSEMIDSGFVAEAPGEIIGFDDGIHQCVPP